MHFPFIFCFCVAVWKKGVVFSFSIIYIVAAWPRISYIALM